MDHHELFARAEGHADFDFYPYNPTNVGGWIFVILFAIAAVIHLGYIIPYRSWFFILFFLGCAGTLPIPFDPFHAAIFLAVNIPTDLSKPKQEATMAAPQPTTTAAPEHPTSCNFSY